MTPPTVTRSGDRLAAAERRSPVPARVGGPHDQLDQLTHQPRVLVVDDEEHITELVAMGLGYNGFEVERAAHGPGRARPRSSRRRPDLIVLDVMLPDLDGFEVARRLRQAEGAGTRVPVIFLTARDATAGQGRGPAPRQRRLRHQAVQHRGARSSG